MDYFFNIKNRISLDLVLFLIFIVSVILMFKSSSDPLVTFLCGTWLEPVLIQFSTGNQLVFDVAVGFVVSIFFYLLVVRVPEEKKRRRLRKALRAQYQMLKGECIKNFLFVCNNSADMSLVEQLKDRTYFKQYFKEKILEDQTRWQAVINEIDAHRVQDILAELEVFRHEVEYVLSSVDVRSDEAFAFLKQLTKTLQKSKNWNHDNNNLKELFWFMWAVHTGWSMVYGYIDCDEIAEMIESI